jgi:hypothetical protein
MLCDVCNCYYSYSHKSQHYASDKHALKEIIQKQYDLNESLIKILKKALNDEPDHELFNHDIINGKEIEFSFDNIYCFKI